MPDTIYTADPPTGSPDTIHYYKTCPQLQESPKAWDSEDIDTSTLDVCEDCWERREHNRRQHIGLSGPARHLVEAEPEDYPLKTDGGETGNGQDNTGVMGVREFLNSGIGRLYLIGATATVAVVGMLTGDYFNGAVASAPVGLAIAIAVNELTPGYTMKDSWISGDTDE